MRTEHQCEAPGGHHHPSSYGMQDPTVVFEGLGIGPGDVFLDAGCGLGEYALAAAEIVGPGGTVYAVDRTPGCIEDLARLAGARGLAQLHAEVADITETLPVPDDAVTACLLATVLHMPRVTRAMPTLFAEIARVLRPGGRVGVIECNQHAFFGPPLPLRLAARRITGLMAVCGLRSCGVTDMGYNYLAIFERPRP